MKRSCWKCKKAIEEAPHKIGFRELCPFCSAALHCCVNCQFYSPGKPNDCAVPGTDFIRDREAINFCDEFSLKKEEKHPSSDAIKRARRLLGDEEGPDEKKGFDSLFKD